MHVVFALHLANQAAKANGERVSFAFVDPDEPHISKLQEFVDGRHVSHVT
ncbi:MAG: hypothetical protein U0S50_16835 [Sphingopyxis sp.]|nr:hypothetical protein [Sphingopyxis sp.]MDZ3833460.1 hypothetical protein [Sphingopyxis sp.]